MGFKAELDMIVPLTVFNYENFDGVTDDSQLDCGKLVYRMV